METYYYCSNVKVIHTYPLNCSKNLIYFIVIYFSRFVYPNNQYDSLSLALGVSSSDPLRETRLALLTKLGLSGVTHYSLYRGDSPVSAELLAFVRIFNMNQGEWSAAGGDNS